MSASTPGGPPPGAYRALATLAFALCFSVWGLVAPLAPQFQGHHLLPRRGLAGHAPTRRGTRCRGQHRRRWGYAGSTPTRLARRGEHEPQGASSRAFRDGIRAAEVRLLTI